MKTRALTKMKLIAFMVLLSMAILFIYAFLYNIGWLKAFSEAALIGGLADWFAVVALFRHPLGLPIPHTALIPNNKDRIGENLGKFVSEEFLTREKLEEKLDEYNFAEKGSSWLSQRENAKKISKLMIENVIPGMLNVINDDDVKKFIQTQFKEKLESINFGEWLGIGLDSLTKEGRHQQLFTTILEKLHREIHVYEEKIRSKVGDSTPWYTFGFIDDKLAKGIIYGLEEFLGQAKHPDSDVRKEVDQQLNDFIKKLKSSPEMQENINSFTSVISNNKDIQAYINGIWDEIKVWVSTDLAKQDDSKIENAMTDMFQTVGNGLREDKILIHKMNDFIKNNVLSKLIDNKRAIGDFIAITVKSWDTNEVANKLELEIGSDLQYIRLNGTIVGGLIGITIFFILEFVK